MKKFMLILLGQLFTCITLSAQFFSGYFVSDPSMDDFAHLKIHHHHSKQHKYEGNLSVKGFSNSGELWEIDATMITGAKANFYIDEFGKQMNIETVYEFKISLDGIEEDFVLLGFENEEGHPQFLAVEEIFESEKEEELLELRSFNLIKAHHLQDE